MSVKPILFNTEMVKALLEDRKTATRRIADINPDITCNDGTTNHEFVPDNFNHTLDKPTGFVCRKCGFGVAPPHSRVPCGSALFRPRYWPGDILYVRETWSFWPCYDCDNEMCYGRGINYKDTDGCFVYKTQRSKVPYDEKWSPSIHMPKEAARIFRRVTNVRVERLQDITVKDAAMEGIDSRIPDEEADTLCDYCPLEDENKGVHCYGGAPVMCEGKYCPEAMDAWEEEFIGEFAELWDSTIKPADLPTRGWEANPWVWVIEFERCEKPKEEV